MRKNEEQEATIARQQQQIEALTAGLEEVSAEIEMSRAAPQVAENHRRQSEQSRLELGCVSAVDSNGRTTFVADAHCDDGKRFVVHADEKLTAFVELEGATRGA
jgi:hypothetical protein